MRPVFPLWALSWGTLQPAISSRDFEEARWHAATNQTGCWKVWEMTSGLGLADIPLRERKVDFFYFYPLFSFIWQQSLLRHSHTFLTPVHSLWHVWQFKLFGKDHHTVLLWYASNQPSSWHIVSTPNRCAHGARQIFTLVILHCLTIEQ